MPSRKIRELAPARVEGEAEDLLVLVAGDAATHVQASDTKTQGHLSEREICIYSAAGNLRVELARRYADRHKISAITDQVVESPERLPGPADGWRPGLPAHLGDGFSHV